MQLKPITPAGIPSALKKVERYRLLNDAVAAESICLDVLEVDAGNQEALHSLILAITDQLETEGTEGVARARKLLPRIENEYVRHYLAGIICERRGKAQVHRGALGSGEVAADWFREAMTWYARAEAMRPANNDESILRWNSCVRMLGKHEPSGRFEPREYEPTIGE
ncbi:MAG: hypothetical protein ABIR92_09290 [Gemmatimonadaceae bacterium]